MYVERKFATWSNSKNNFKNEQFEYVQNSSLLESMY